MSETDPHNGKSAWEIAVDANEAQASLAPAPCSEAGRKEWLELRASEGESVSRYRLPTKERAAAYITHLRSCGYTQFEVWRVVEIRNFVAVDEICLPQNSPPYDTIHAGSGGLNHLPAKEDGQQSGRAAGASQTEVDNRYGDEEGQIGKLAKGELAAVVTSPPYADTMSPAAGGADTQHPDGCNRAMQGRKGYGAEDGQIGAIGTPGTVEGAVTSPPWEAGATGHVGADKFADPAKYAEGMKESGRCSAEARLAQFERDKEKSYGDSQGQIGTLEKETYWQAMRQVYESLFRSLKPGGYAAIVVKDFVRKKKRVQLCDDTLRLLCFVGFDGVERIHAMLVEPLPTHGVTDMLGMPTGESASVQKKSFFRRLHESKPGAVKIDYEEVIIVQKPYE